MSPAAASTSAGAAANGGSSSNAAQAQQASGGQSRLDRLVTLLDTGSTPAIRSTAARQLGQIAAVRVGRGDGSSVDAASSSGSSSSSTAKASVASTSASAEKEAKPTYRGTDGEWGEALHLLARVLPYLRSPSWDTRTAASHAIELICAACGVWDPRVKPVTAEAATSTSDDDAAAAAAAPPPQSNDLMAFATFSLADVCSKGTKLLSSAGSEYDVSSGLSVAERLANAKRDMERLGLGGMAGEELDLGIDVEQELGVGEARRGSESKAPAGRRDSTIKTANLPPPRFTPLPPGKGLPPPRFAPQPSPSGSATSSPKITTEATFAAVSPGSSRGSAPPPPAPASTVTTPSVEMAEPDLSKLSARERNQLKRKRKLGLVASAPAPSAAAAAPSASASPGASESKTRVVESKTASTSGTAPDGVRIRSANWTGTAAGEGASTPGSTIEAPAAAAGASPTSLVPPIGTWPFATVCALLQADLFSPKWEIRHGAALGLRSLLTTQGACGGMVSHPSVVEAENDSRHAAWCADMAIRLLCVLSLDRLGDFVFDQVVTPVRETSAQALAALLKHMPRLGAQQTHAKLMAMVRQDWVLPPGESKDAGPGLPAGRKFKGYAWEVRHAGLLGLRWEVTVRPDLLVEESADGDVEMTPVGHVKQEEAAGAPSKILRRIVELSVQCLRDDDDDVRNVAAQTLLSVVDQLVAGMPDELPGVLAQLWNCLEDLKDDLSSSTGGVMDLLAKLVQHPQVIALLTSSSARPLTELLPRLFPFFRHTITSVRLSLLNALNVFLGVESLPRGWIDAPLLRLLFQNLIVEERPAIRAATSEAWGKAIAALAAEGRGNSLTHILGPHMTPFFRILMTSLGSPFDFALFYQASTSARQTHNIDKHILAQDMTLVGVDTIVRGRLSAAHALGSVMSYWPAEGQEAAYTFANLLHQYIDSAAALHRCLAAAVVQEWAEAATARGTALATASTVAQQVGQQLLTHLEAPAPATYMEMAVMLQRIQLDAQGLYNTAARDCKVAKAVVPTLPSKVDPLAMNGTDFTIETAKHVAGKGLEELLAQSSSAKARKAGEAAVEERRRKLLVSIGFYQSTKEQQDTQVFASVAGAVIALQMLPAKLNPVIRSIMNSVKFEENADLQMRSARSVASFVALCSTPGARANPSDKIIKNLCAFVCQDTARTPIFASAKVELEGITSMREAPAPAATGRAAAVATETEEVRQSRLIRRGAEVTLKELAARFGEALFDTVPTLWACSSAALVRLFGTEPAELSDEDGQFILDACTLVQVIMPELHVQLHARMLELLQPLTVAIQSKYAVVRGAAAKALSVMADCAPEATMQHIVQHVVPYLGDARNVTKRQGAVETISQIVRLLDIKLLPYVIVLIVPVLGRMGDSDENVRLVATNTFALLVKMVPLEAGLPDPPGLSRELMERREHERKFLAQLLDGSKVEPYEMPVKVNAELRSYQRDGVSWMAFLAKYQLHGILCDDMGLGKTLQSICILSAQHYERAQRFEATRSPDSAPLPSLIVCPPTLTGHWFHEIKQYSTNLRPLLYVGLPQERVRLQGHIEQHDVIVTSYDTVRNDIAVLAKFNWLYCVLDEGHVIKSGKTKTSKAVKSIKANHRLLLSGTPIQNNVLELWSLFDFLMPGFLGTERAFNERFGKPIVALRDGKVTAREQESASLALEALHKQVLPFLLRRLKEDVLDDLPPKIIQDIECDLGTVQKQLYDEYSRTQEGQELDAGEAGAGGEGKQHVFQTLQYLRKLVNHPSLVFDAQNAKHREIEKSIVKSGGSLRDIAHAPKLQALKQLLNDCGIGQSGIADAGSDVLQSDAAVSQHRVLIFCQLKQMLDIIETDLFKAHMPSVSYMRLDGSVAADKRHGVVQTFNADPSIDVLLLTTQVGGLGLTLTGADTVIFVEHDWNPMKDLQAMDRAHRLGQKKVVNVYRLITRNTLEAKIMGLQRFKLHVAGSVVTQQNAGLESMQTDQVLDLFDTTGAEGAAKSTKKSTGAISQKALLEAIENAPDTGDDYTAAAEWKA